MPLRLVVAEQEAAFGFFALHHHFDRVARLELGLAVVIQHLLQRNETFGLEADVDHHVLVRQLDDGAGDDVVVIGLGGGFSGLLAVKRFQRGGEVFHAGQFGIFPNGVGNDWLGIDDVVRHAGGYSLRVVG